jgi:hypothetical protein
MVTFGGGIVDIVGLGHLHAHLLKGLADFLSSFHNGRFYPIYNGSSTINIVQGMFDEPKLHHFSYMEMLPVRKLSIFDFF